MPLMMVPTNVISMYLGHWGQATSDPQCGLGAPV